MTAGHRKTVCVNEDEFKIWNSKLVHFFLKNWDFLEHIKNEFEKLAEMNGFNINYDKYEDLKFKEYEVILNEIRTNSKKDTKTKND